MKEIEEYTIGVSEDEVLRVLYAESAWITFERNRERNAWRPLTEDNRELLKVFIKEWWQTIGSRLSGYITEFNDLSEDGLYRLTVRNEGGALSKNRCRVSALIERVLVNGTMENLYLDDEAHRMFQYRREEAMRSLMLIFAR